MTNEDDFHAALDAHPEDWQCRLVFADWLEERGDPRAEGYRALGVLRRRPMGTREWYWMNTPMGRTQWARHDFPWRLGYWWHRLVCDSASIKAAHFGTRRAAEDAAATAFLKMPAARRVKLLATAPA